MKADKTHRGFRIIEHASYANEPKLMRLLQESSAVGEYRDSFDKPGSSFLWFGADHHLNREEVKQTIKIMKTWLKTGRLPKEL